MLIGELNGNCEKCSLNLFCAKVGQKPQLCNMQTLNYVDEKKYSSLVNSIAEKEIEDKMNHASIKSIEDSLYDNKKGAICDLVLEKLLFNF